MQSPIVIARKLEKFMNRAYVLDSQIIDRLASCAERRPVSRMEPLCVEGEIFDKFIFVSEGVFMLSRVMNGEVDTIAFGVEGDPYTSVATYLYDKPSLFSYTPVTDGEVIVINNEDFKQAVAETDLVSWLNTVLLRQVHALENRYVWLGQSDAYSRYHRLIELRNEIVTQVPLKYIASYLGVTQSTLSRIRARSVGKG